MLRVVSAGIPRSGSTWLFNAVRLLLKSQNCDVYAAWIDEFDYEITADACVVKVHVPDTRLASTADMILCSHRDLRDVVSSLRSMGWTDLQQMVATARNVREMHEFWSPRSALDLAYEDIKTRPSDALSALADALDIQLSEPQKRLIVSSMPSHAASRDQLGYDPVSLLHPGHITDGRPGRWKEQLPSAVANEIWADHSDWLALRGYSRSGA